MLGNIIKIIGQIIFIFVVFSFNVQANLILNSGFELGVDGFKYWTRSGDAALRDADPVAYSGIYYVYGEGPALVTPGTETFKIYQEIDLVGSGLLLPSDIDTDNLEIEFGGWQSGWGPIGATKSDGDTGQIFVRLLDTDKVEIGVISLPAFTSHLSWAKQSGITALLSNTRYVRYEFAGTRNYGNHTDAYLDDAYLNIVGVQLVPNISVTNSHASVDDLQVTFGEVTMNKSSNAVITITNHGYGDLNIGNIATQNWLEAPFRILGDTTCSNVTVTPRKNCELTVIFEPTSEGTINDSFDIPSDDADEASITVKLSGTGVYQDVPAGSDGGGSTGPLGLLILILSLVLRKRIW